MAKYSRREDGDAATDEILRAEATEEAKAKIEAERLKASGLTPEQEKDIRRLQYLSGLDDAFEGGDPDLIAERQELDLRLRKEGVLSEVEMDPEIQQSM